MAPIWALVTFTRDGECLVDSRSLRASAPFAVRGNLEPTFGADDAYGDDLGDDLGEDDVGDDLGDDLGDDFEDDVGDELGDDLGDDLGDEMGDELGDEIGLSRRERQARLRRRESRLAKKNRALKRRLHRARQGKIVQRNVTVTGAVATTVGQSMSVTLTPRTSLHLSKIFATGDTSATINTIISGDDPVVLDNLDAALLAPTAYHGPGFSGRVLKAGVPVTINYTAGSTTTALKLSFYGKVRVKSSRC